MLGGSTSRLNLKRIDNCIMLKMLTSEMQAEYQASITPENWKRTPEQRGIALEGNPIEAPGLPRRGAGPSAGPMPA